MEDKLNRVDFDSFFVYETDEFRYGTQDYWISGFKEMPEKFENLFEVLLAFQPDPEEDFDLKDQRFAFGVKKLKILHNRSGF